MQLAGILIGDQGQTGQGGGSAGCLDDTGHLTDILTDGTKDKRTESDR